MYPHAMLARGRESRQRAYLMRKTTATRACSLSCRYMFPEDKKGTKARLQVR